MKKKKTVMRAAFAAAVLILALVIIYSGLQILQATVLLPSAEDHNSVSSKTITRDGVDYFPRQDITVILAMGIDERGPVQESNSYRNHGEADAVILLILDQTEETYSVLCLNRDSMVVMPALGLGGKQAGTFYGQLALSHTYGKGLEDSCENTRNTVSDLLYDIRIDHYVALNMDAIGILNDAVGGVTVNVTDDFSEVDASLPMGEVKLNADQALVYVQSRAGVGSQLNISRMERHEQYMNGFMLALTGKLDASDAFILDAYNQVAEYMVTDCSINMISGLLQRCADYTLKEIISPEGENVLGEEYYEFYIDEEKLDELILRLFYAEKK